VALATPENYMRTLVLPLLLLCPQALPPAEYYVSPQGRDSDPGTKEAPFATLSRARSAVRAVAGTRPVAVVLRGGTYRLPETLVLGPQDSGTAEAPVLWKAFPGEKAIVSGGRPISGWKKTDRGLWTAQVPDTLRFNQLFVDGARRTRARTPNLGEFFRVDGDISLGKPARFHARANDFRPEWAERGDVEVIALQAWAEFRMPVVPGRTATAKGVRGKALSVDGTTGFREVPHSAALDPAQFTLEAWIQVSRIPEDTSDRRRWIVAKGANEWTDGHYSLAVNGTEVGAYLNVGGGRDGERSAWSSNGPLKIGAWQHLAMTFDGSVLQVYANGDRVASTEIRKARPPSREPLAIGRRPDGYRTFCGLIDEVRLYPRVLSTEELRAHVAQPDALPKEVPSAAWDFEEAPDPREVTLAGACAPSNREHDARYWFENAIEMLDAPGEWFLDRKTGGVSYLPLDGEDPGRMDAVAPAIRELVRLEGHPEAHQPISHVGFSGITFSHADWSTGASGYTDMQAAVDIPAAISARGAVACALENCVVAHVGGYGIELGRGCRENRIVRCEIVDAGAGGIKIGETALRQAPDDRTAQNEITDNHIHDLGHVFPAGVAVWVGHSSRNRLAHNHIHDTYYSGFSVGWSWGYGPSGAQDNLIEYNLVHDIGRGMLADMGGIYTLGTCTGTVIRNNVFHDVRSSTYGGWGIYFDEGSTGVIAENNLAYRCTSNGFHQHYGRENTLRNNIFALNHEAQIARTRNEAHFTLLFQRNLIYWKEGKLLSGNWEGGQFRFENNLFWNPAGTPGLPETWKAQGLDVGSVAANPLFVDPERGDFALRPESPAYKLGFQAIDVSQVGPRP
jgi:hypothetical protein